MGKDEKHFVARVRDARFIDQPWRPVSDLGWTLFALSRSGVRLWCAHHQKENRRRSV